MTATTRINKRPAAKSRSVSCGWLVAVALILAACGDDGSDERTKLITPGITRDSLLRLLGSGPATGSPSTPGQELQNIWRSAPYFVNSQYIEILWYSRHNEHRTASDTIPENAVFPILLRDEIVVGTGHKPYDSVSKLYNIPKSKY